MPTSGSAEFLFNNRDGSIDELNLPAAQTDGSFPTYVLGTTQQATHADRIIGRARQKPLSAQRRYAQ